MSGVTLSPAFASGTTAYTASVGHAAAETTVTPTAAAGAAYEVKLNGVVDQDGVVPLAVGAGNVIAVIVTAQDGETTQTYSVTSFLRRQESRGAPGEATPPRTPSAPLTVVPAKAGIQGHWAGRPHPTP